MKRTKEETLRLTKLQEAFEKRYAKHQRNPFVKGLLIATDPQFEEKAAALAKEIQVPPKVVEKTVIAAILHQNQKYHTVDAQVLLGVFLSALDYPEDGDKKFEDFLASDRNQWMFYEKRLGQFGEYISIEVETWLDEESSKDLDNYQHPWMMVIEPRKTTPKNDGHLVAIEVPNSRGSGPNPGCPCYDLDRANRILF